jgi:hypothetical protein
MMEVLLIDCDLGDDSKTRKLMLLYIILYIYKLSDNNFLGNALETEFLRVSRIIRIAYLSLFLVYSEETVQTKNAPVRNMVNPSKDQ